MWNNSIVFTLPEVRFRLQKFGCDHVLSNLFVSSDQATRQGKSFVCSLVRISSCEGATFTDDGNNPAIVLTLRASVFFQKGSPTHTMPSDGSGRQSLKSAFPRLVLGILLEFVEVRHVHAETALLRHLSVASDELILVMVY